MRVKFKIVLFLRQTENLVSCLSTLFGVDEFEIQEDFLQISELVTTENTYMNRLTPVDPTDQFSPQLYFKFDYFDLMKPLDYNMYMTYESNTLPNGTFLIGYLGSPAILSEEISALGESV